VDEEASTAFKRREFYLHSEKILAELLKK